MANRTAFIDFAQGLLNLNPLERWTPNQAKAHPFITQSKFTGPFVPPMTLRQTSSKSPAPGVQEQQRAEALSKQRQQAQQQQQQQQAQAQQQAAYASMQMQYATPPVPSQQQYAMYSPGVAAPPPYAAVPSYGGQVPLANAGMPMAGGSSGALPRYQPQVARQQPAPPQVQPPQMYGQAPVGATAGSRGDDARRAAAGQHAGAAPERHPREPAARHGPPGPQRADPAAAVAGVLPAAAGRRGRPGGIAAAQQPVGTGRRAWQRQREQGLHQDAGGPDAGGGVHEQQSLAMRDYAWNTDWINWLRLLWTTQVGCHCIPRGRRATSCRRQDCTRLPVTRAWIWLACSRFLRQIARAASCWATSLDESLGDFVERLQ
jgi:hypothetical protein